VISNWRIKRQFGDHGRRARELGDQAWRSRENGDFAGNGTELHRTLDSPVNFGPGEEVPHLGSGAAHRRATSISGISGKTAVGGASIGSGT